MYIQMYIVIIIFLVDSGQQYNKLSENMALWEKMEQWHLHHFMNVMQFDYLNGLITYNFFFSRQ